MYFELDYYNKPVCPKLFLANPNKDYIGILSLNDKPKFTFNGNNICTLSFKIYSKKNGEYNPYYNEIENKKLIEAQYQGWFQITEVSDDENGKYGYKEVTAKSLENELTRKRIFDIDGVFDLYNPYDESISLLHIICKETGYTWTIGHVDNELIGKARTFSIDSSNIYSLLNDDIATSFQCIIQYDTYNRQINVVTLEHYGSNSNLILSYKNLVENNLINSKEENITTVFKVTGGDDLDIRGVNPNGSNKLMNVDYYKTRKSQGGWMSDELVDALDTYDVKYNCLVVNYTNLQTQLKSTYSELNTLYEGLPDVTIGQSATDWTKYGYNQLQIKYDEYDIVATTLAKAGASNTSDSAYSQYLSNWNIMQAISSEMTIRKSQIDVKESLVNSIDEQLDTISDSLVLENNLTTNQIKELNTFITEDDYIDDTFVVAETDSEEDAIEIKQELMKIASDELARVSQPQFTIDTTLKNLFALPEFKTYHDKFALGNIITILFRDDYVITARLLSIEIDFNNLETISVTFSNKNKLDSDAITLAKIQAQSEANNTTINYGGLSWDKAKEQTSVIQDYMTGTLNAATQKIVNSSSEEVSFGQFGIRCRKWIETQNKYDRHEAWWNSNTLLFSDDNFKSSKAGIGLFTDSNGNEYYGFIGERIIGNLVMSSALKVVNSSGNFSITNDGFVATATSGSNTYTVGINPNTPSSIFRIAVNGNDKLYIDTINNRLVYSGHLSAATGTFSGSLSAATGTFSGNLSAAGGTFTGTLQGVNGTFSGTITASSGNISGFTIYQNELESGTGDKYIRISPVRSLDGQGGYNTSYASFDLGMYGSDTRVHLRSDGYCRFGLNSENGAVRFNYIVGGVRYPFYSTGFKTDGDGTVYLGGNVINSGGLTISSTGYIAFMANKQFELSAGSSLSFYGTSMKFNDYTIVTSSNISSYLPSSLTASSVKTGYLTMSGGTIVADSGSLWIGQNTVKAETITQTSSARFKKNIDNYLGSALDIINSTVMRTYHYKSESDLLKKHIGLIVEESPEEIINNCHDGLDLGAMVSIVWKAVQELNNKYK